MSRNKSFQDKGFLSEVREQVKAVNYVLEVLDARAPYSSRNPAIKEAVKARNNIIILNKSDLADRNVTRDWLEYFRKQGHNAVSYNSTQPSSVIYSLIKRLSPDKQTMRFKRPCRIMVVGVPNTGKSTIINSLLHRRAAKTGNRSGITRGRQWIRLKPGLELLDTPGIIQPFVNDKTFSVLAALGVLPDNRWDPYETAQWLIEEAKPENLLNNITERYTIRNVTADTDTESILKLIGQKRGCLQPGGEIDLHQSSRLFLKELREGLMGAVSLEKPAE